MSESTPMFTSPRPTAWVLFLLAFGTCFALGTWQIERLEWKRGLIAAIETANAEAPLAKLPESEADLKTLEFRKVALSGHWVEGAEFHLAPRYWRDQFGYAILNPLKLTDGRIVLVNRGWVPAAQKAAEKRPETAVHGKANLTGILRMGHERSYFTPANQPEKNLWFGRDVADMAAYAKLSPVIPAMVDRIGEQTALPIPSDGTIRVRNDHLSYILTWYGIALGILVIFVMAHRRR